ncbi:MAG: transposase [Candidatus Scalindua sp.]|nr:transposase [Candidatus Scalindua sp.]
MAFLLLTIPGVPNLSLKNTEAAKWQYCVSLKRSEICNVAVGAAFVSKAKHFPIDVVPYLPADEFPGGKKNPHFKDKIQIAIELFDNALESFDFSATSFDSWYSSNQLDVTDKTVITNYLMPWGIEQCFKELKDTFYLDHYQVRHINKIERYWNLCLIAWTLTYWIKQNAYLAKILLETKPSTFNEFKQAINSLL